MAVAPPRKILVTSALPYANAPLHLGHMLEQVQTDIWVRFQQSRGHDCVYVCARSEEHTSELQSRSDLVCRLLLEKKNNTEYPNLILHQWAQRASRRLTKYDVKAP